MSKKQTRINTKKETFFGQMHRERTNVLKTHKFVKMYNKKVKRYLKHAEVAGRVFEMKVKKGGKTSKKNKQNKERGRSFQEENYSFF